LALERLTLDARCQPMQLLAPAAVDFTTGMSISMLGQIDATRPPRWSIARDVLGWLD
jgi:hypothetical protein